MPFVQPGSNVITVPRVDPNALARFVERVFLAAGLDAEKASTTAKLLVLTDMMGRSTHGVAQCAAYVNEIASGGMTATGEPDVFNDLGATVVWDGGYRPGLWLVDRALALGFERVKQNGTSIIAIRKSHHIGCLGALAKSATDRGLFVMIASSGPHTKAVAPFGGTQGLFSPNPIAVGFPTADLPIIVDMTASLATISTVREKVAAGAPLDHAWLLDPSGKPTRDPTVLERKENRGSMLLLGGVEAGHKGFGLAVIVEALTQGFSGHGRADGPTRWGASVFIQLIDPAALAGRDAFAAQTEYFASHCRANAPADPAFPVRMPGEQAQRRLEDAERRGVLLSAAAIASLKSCAARLKVDDPLLHIIT
jgi:LDH2 family malate/lactate/ureidoglycolate dehydrogenase